MRGIRALAAGVAAAIAAGLAASGGAFAAEPPLQPHDYVLKDFKFRSGETLPALKLRYYTLGEPKKDAAGQVTNAVLILHGTGGSGRQFTAPQFADVLFAPGGELDPAKYFLILPDDIGHGASSKPSDGLRMKFPHYDYFDMVEAEHAVGSQALGGRQLRLVMGTSMGCMHSFMYVEMFPDGAKAALPLACQTVALGGRNRLWREMAVTSIKADPAWQGGDYKAELTWVNSSDDFINPPELGLAQTEIKRIRNGKFVLIPFGPNTHGHGTHTWAE